MVLMLMLCWLQKFRMRWRLVTNQQLPYIHFTVNHSLFFVELMTGAHTQHIEANWVHVMMQICKLMRNHGTASSKLLGGLVVVQSTQRNALP